ncbi:IS1 family transposase (plasmid) [Pseudanabaena biceps]|nr:IS1 family transposase [Pseudanabaena biceps]NUN65787.1 IS1 family transposase [Pseudanabaena biceps]NUN66394.1 IS1 family transposase [Pseudanabaena biceps]NUN66677.1 IS1 family transposase [Pseudanabaena biceps]NUN66738.1 IS1 family transposase [Pseudanabaena biceps]
MPNCPNCNSKDVVKNGFIHNGNQNHKCKACGRQFVEAPRQKLISEETKALIDKLLLEKIPLAGIARVCDVSETWLQNYVNRKYEAIPQQVNVSAKKKGRLTIQCDEMWSFVGNKGNKQWIWLAIDVDTREIVGVHIGDRSAQGAQKLWNSLPSVYRQCAVAYTDFWNAYSVVFPDMRHIAVGKETGKTNYIERFNCTMRQRISRLVRKTLSFSKKIENHIGAIWFFIHHYNSSLLV